HADLDHGLARLGQPLAVLEQPPRPAQPGECPLRHPALRQADEPLSRRATTAPRRAVPGGRLAEGAGGGPRDVEREVHPQGDEGGGEEPRGASACDVTPGRYLDFISMPSGSSGPTGSRSKVIRSAWPSGSALRSRSASSTESTLIRKMTPAPLSWSQNCSILPSR